MAIKGIEPYYDIDYSHYDYTNEFRNFYLDRKALSDVPVSGVNYVFFTSPELSITSTKFSNSSNQFYLPENVIRNNINVLKLPTDGAVSIYSNEMITALSGESGNFLHILTNRCSSLPASSVQLSTIDSGETWNKYKVLLGTSSKDSKISGNFELMMREDDNLTVTKMHKLWMEYIENLFLGRIVSAHANHRELHLTQDQVVDYLSSVYTFSLLPDGRTIQHWSKYTGVFPTKIPYEVFASEDGEFKNVDRFNFEYQFSYKEDLDIAILRDFNLVASAINASKLTRHKDANSSYNDMSSVSSVDIPRRTSKGLGVNFIPAVVQNEKGKFELLLQNNVYKNDDEYRSNIPTR